jgi:hypothetical protein
VNDGCNNILLRKIDFKMIYQFDIDQSAVKVITGIYLATSNYLTEVNDVIIRLNLDS